MFTIDVTVTASIEAVFHLLAGVEEAPLWYSALTSVERLSAGATGQGSEFIFSREIGGRIVRNTVVISSYAPNHVIELFSRSGPTPFTYRFVLVPLSGDTTRVQLYGSISGDGLQGAAAALAPLAETFFEQGMRANLRTFKGLAEKRSALGEPEPQDVDGR